jgi:hypothetical protein
MPASKTNTFVALLTILLTLLFNRLTTNMTTPEAKSLATHPCALISTPQYVTKKVFPVAQIAAQRPAD